MRFIDADLLKRHIRWNFNEKGSWLESCELIDSIIDAQTEINPLERDNGAEPILENHTSVYHESYANGTGAMKSKTSLEWRCPQCGWFVGELYCGFGKWHVQGETSYCGRCGQKIDWTKPKDEEKRRYEQTKSKEREETYKQSGIRLDNMNERMRKRHGIPGKEVGADEID